MTLENEGHLIPVGTVCLSSILSSSPGHIHQCRGDLMGKNMRNSHCKKGHKDVAWIIQHGSVSKIHLNSGICRKVGGFLPEIVFITSRLQVPAIFSLLLSKDQSTVARVYWFNSFAVKTWSLYFLFVSYQQISLVMSLINLKTINLHGCNFLVIQIFMSYLICLLLVVLLSW